MSKSELAIILGLVLFTVLCIGSYQHGQHTRNVRYEQALEVSPQNESEQVLWEKWRDLGIQGRTQVRGNFGSVTTDPKAMRVFLAEQLQTYRQEREAMTKWSKKL